MSAQIGAVLLLGFLVIGLSIVQTTVVPNENEQTEFRHSQAVQQDLQELRNSIVRTASLGASQPQTVQIGTTYRGRTLFVNPPPPSGRLSTGPPGNYSLGNVTVRDEAGEYWNGTTNVSTKPLRYDADYNEYRNAPQTVYESTVVVNRFDGGRDLLLTDQQLVDANRVTLVSLSGNLSRARAGELTVDPRAISTVSRTVTIEDNFTLVVPTSLSADTWRTNPRLFGNEYDGTGNENNDRYVDRVEPVAGSEAIRVVFERNASYELRLGRVALGTGAVNPPPAYVVPVSPTGSLPAGSTTDVTFEARDTLGNPASGVPMRLSIGGSTYRRTTNDQGRVTVRYAAPDSPRTTFANATIDTAVDPTAPTFEATTPENSTLPLRVTVGGSGGPANDVAWRLPRTSAIDCVPATGSGAGACRPIELTATVRNSTGAPTVAAPVGFRSGNSSVADLSPSVNATDEGGVTGTMLQVRQLDRTVRLYASSGGDTEVLGARQLSESDFEDGLGTWEENETGGTDGSALIVPDVGNDGSDAVELDDGTGNNSGVAVEQSRGTNASAADLLVVDYWAKQSGGVGDGHNLTVEYLAADGRWEQVDSIAGNGSSSDAQTFARRVRINATNTPDTFHDDFRLRFRTTGGNGEWYVDDVNVTAFGEFEALNGSGDTTPPATPATTSLTPDPFGNEDVTVDVSFQSPPESGTVTVRLTDKNDNRVTATAQSNTNGDTTSVTVPAGQVSGLADGDVTVDARIVDDGGRENQDGYTASSVTVKDASAPGLSGVQVSDLDANPTRAPTGDRTYGIGTSFESDEPLASFDVTLDGPSGTETYDESDFDISGSGPYTYTLRTDAPGGNPPRPYRAEQDGTYTATVSNAVDAAGNVAPDETGSETVDHYGARYELYEASSGTYEQLSDVPFGRSTPDLVETGQQDRPFNSDADDGSDFAYRYTAYVYAPSDGTYRFQTSSDDGSRLYVDGGRVVNNDGLHSVASETGSVSLTQGWHNLTVTYFEHEGQDELDASWQPPGAGELTPLPESNLVPRVPVGSSVTGGGSGFDATWSDPVVPAASGGSSTCTIPCSDPIDVSVDTGRQGDTVTFGSSDSGVASFTSSRATTGGSGRATVGLRLGDVGTATLTADANGGSDTTTVEVVSNDNFNSNSNSPNSLGAWEAFGSGTAETSQEVSNSGSRSVEFNQMDDGGIRTEETYDTSNLDAIVLDFWALEGGDGNGDNPDTGQSPPENLVVEYQTATGDWTRVDEVQLTDGSAATEANRRVVITADAAKHDGFRLRIRQLSATASDNWYVDDVKVAGIGGSIPTAGGQNSLLGVEFATVASTALDPVAGRSAPAAAAGSGVRLVVAPVRAAQAAEVAWATWSSEIGSTVVGASRGDAR